jgi:mevalonate pyrophosphate decarboxylase
MKPNPFISLYQSRKSIVASVALVLVGLVYFFGHGDENARIAAMGSIAGIAIAIITAIGREDSAEKSATVVVNDVEDRKVIQ